MEEAVVCVLESDEADMTFIMEFLVHIYAHTYLLYVFVYLSYSVYIKTNY